MLFSVHVNKWVKDLFSVMSADQEITLLEAITLISTATEVIEGENGESVTVGAYDYTVEPSRDINISEPIETSIPEVCVVSTEAGYDPTIAELFS